jgi:hypothetical protein
MAWGEANSLLRQGDIYSNKPGAAKTPPGPSSFNGSNKIATFQEIIDNYNITYTCPATSNLCPKYGDITFNDLNWQSGLILYLNAADNYGTSSTTWSNKASTGSANNFTLNSFVYDTNNGWLLSGNQKALVNATVGDGGSSGYTGVRWASSNFIHSATQGTIIFNWYNGYGYSGYKNNKFILGNQTVAMSNDTILFEQFANSSEITFYHRQNGTEYSLVTSGAGLQISGATSKTYACIAFVYNGPVWTIYVNGVQRATGSSFPNITNNSSYKWNLFSLESGRYSSSGAISHLLVYNRAMTLAQTEEVRSIITSSASTDYITVSTTYCTLDANGIDVFEYSYDITASGPWTATKPSWVRISQTSGSGSVSLFINATTNTSLSERYGTIVLTCGTATASIYVTQETNGDMINQIVKMI